ncbi:hypothetical protein [Christiangramia aquimixticola]|uniref:hypothetical protein n=1 Tax=Christiangramia aquimixticola TaxID=1697558 RepID=UPI003AA7C436
MIDEIFFTLTEYKRNYEKIKNDFVNAYEDNDEDEFISLQTEWYQKCLETAKIDRGFAGDTIGWFPKSLLNGDGVIWKVYEKIRKENGEIDRMVAQNLCISFGKILKFLKTRETEAISEKDIKTTAAQWALYYYFLQENKIMPPFHEKTSEIKALAKEYKIGWKNFEMKYNAINNSRGLEGYSNKDIQAVLILLKNDYPSLIPQFEKMVFHST